MNTSQKRWSAIIALATMWSAQVGVPHSAPAAPVTEVEALDTASPIKHVIVLIGENRTFDHTYATYQPKHGQTVANLLSRGIIDKRGQPGDSFGESAQFQVKTPLPLAYFISVGADAKTPYAPFLPTPDLGGAPNHAISLTELIANPTGVQPPFGETISDDALAMNEPSLRSKDLDLLRTGATGGPRRSGPDPPVAPRAAPPDRLR